MTKVTVFEEPEASIELLKYVNSSTLEITDCEARNKLGFKELVYLGKSEGGMDWIMGVDGEYKYIFLGHWNDGVV